MGKSAKKSATKADVAPALALPIKPVKKGKRDAEEVIEKQVSAKKQKKDIAIKQAVKSEAKTRKKNKKQVKSEDSSTDSEEEQKAKLLAKKGGTPAKPPVEKSSSDDDTASSDEDTNVKSMVLSKTQPIPTAKNGTVGTPATKGRLSSNSGDSNSSDESDSEDDEDKKSKVMVPSKKVPIAAVKNSLVAAASKKDESSDDSDSDGSSRSDDDKNSTKAVSEPKKLPSSAAKNGSVVPKKKDESSDSSEEESTSDEEDAPATKAVPSERPFSATVTKQKADIEEDDSEEESYEESDDEEPQSKKMKIPPTGVKPIAKAEQNESSSSVEEAPKVQSVKKPIQDSKKSSSSDEESSEEDSSKEEDEKPSKTPKKNSTDVEMVDVASAKQSGSGSGKKAPQTPGTPQVQTTGSKTLFVGNLSFSVEQADVENFFKEAGEIADIRFATDREGAFKGFGHVEFATVEAAQKALKLNRQELLGRQVKLDLARERGSYTPQSGNEDSYHKGGRVQGQTIFIRGFDTKDGEDKIRIALEEHFASCGEISRVSIPKDYDGGVKGIAYMDFKDNDGFNKALELGGSELGESILTVEEAKARGDNRDSGRGGGGRSGGRFGSGGSGGGRFGSRGGGSRFGSRDGGGRFGGRDGGGRHGSGSSGR